MPDEMLGDKIIIYPQGSMCDFKAVQPIVIIIMHI